MWFFRADCNVNCLTNINKSNGVLSSECIYYTLIKGWSKNVLLIKIIC
jgi:hypothetical protein